IVRDAVEVVDGAVDRVDEPRDAARAPACTALLAEDRILRARRLDPSADELLDLAVGRGHDVDDARLRRGDLDTLAPPLGGELPCLEGDRTGQFEKFGAHASSLACGRGVARPRVAACPPTRPRF